MASPMVRVHLTRYALLPSMARPVEVRFLIGDWDPETESPPVPNVLKVPDEATGEVIAYRHDGWVNGSRGTIAANYVSALDGPSEPREPRMELIPVQ